MSNLKTLSALTLALGLSACASAPIKSSTGWVDQTLAGMTLREKIGQLVYPRITGAYMPAGGAEHERIRQWVTEYGIGGVIVSHGPPLEIAAKLNAIQSMAKVPLLVTADMESGPGQILSAGTILPYGLENGGATRFPPIMALGAAGDEKLAYELGRITALEARAVGVHVTFAPVVDVNNNPNNPIINTRSYGAEAALVGRLAAQHIRGLQDNGMIATAKHFPGHGDTGTDSHVDLPIVTVDRQRADLVELPPFRAAIESGVGAVMSAHMAFPAITGDSIPGTLNHRILTGLLRNELHFEGVVFTDAMDMGAIVKTYGRERSVVMAMKAGADVLLQPYQQDLPMIMNALEQAVKSGDLPEARIDEAVRRQLVMKQRLGLHAQRMVDLARVSETVARPDHMLIAQEAADRSITVARDVQKLLPLRGRILSVVYTDDYDPFAGRQFQNALRGARQGTRTMLLNSTAGEVELANFNALADSAEVVLFSPYIRVSAGKNDLAIPAPIAAAVGAIAARKPLVVTAFGNPYVLAQFPDISTYMLAWGQTEVSQRAAARALLGDIPISGKLPIAIPPYHKFGEGLIYTAQ
ncbi:MAG TPA: glycoside hydrolase family 3 N-terminal domain-containing protein [Longimicrobiales bacterium]